MYEQPNNQTTKGNTVTNANVNEYHRLTLTAEVKDLTEQRDQNLISMDGWIEDIENAGDTIAIHRNTIESCERLITDLTDNVILFGNKQINNLKMNNDEINELIAGLKAEIDKISDTTPEPAKAMEAPKVVRAPRTMYGELTDDLSKETFKKYRFLLNMETPQRLEYVAIMRQKGYPESDTNISQSLGKCNGWFGNLVRDAKNAGHTVPNKF